MRSIAATTVFVLLSTLLMANTGTLKLKVVPAGASVTIDGKQMHELRSGYNTLTLDAAGIFSSTQLVITKEGYEPATLDIKIKAGEAQMRWLELRPLIEKRVFFDVILRGKSRLYSCEESISCTLNDQPIDRNEFFFREAPKEYKVTVEKKGYFGNDFTFTSDQNQHLQTKLRKKWSGFIMGYHSLTFNDPVTLKNSRNEAILYDMQDRSDGFYLGYKKNTRWGPYWGATVFGYGSNQESADPEFDGTTNTRYDGSPEHDAYGLELLVGIELLSWLHLEAGMTHTGHSIKREYIDDTFEAEFSTTEPRARIILALGAWRLNAFAADEVSGFEIGLGGKW